MRKYLSFLLIFLLTTTLTGCIGFHEPAYTEGRQSFVEGNYYQAFKQLYPAAQGGNPDAQYAVGYMYYYGLGTGQDRQAAVSWMQKAANQGQSQAASAVQAILNSGYTATSGYSASSLSRPSLLRSSGSTSSSSSSNRSSAPSSNTSADVPDEASSKRRATWPLPRDDSSSATSSQQHSANTVEEANMAAKSST